VRPQGPRTSADSCGSSRGRSCRRRPGSVNRGRRGERRGRSGAKSGEDRLTTRDHKVLYFLRYLRFL